VTGISITPNLDILSMTNPMLTVNSPFLLTNSLVPSSGSTKKKTASL